MHEPKVPDLTPLIYSSRSSGSQHHIDAYDSSSRFCVHTKPTRKVQWLPMSVHVDLTICCRHGKILFCCISEDAPASELRQFWNHGMFEFGILMQFFSWSCHFICSISQNFCYLNKNPDGGCRWALQQRVLPPLQLSILLDFGDFGLYCD